jgi:hypothetical protein
MMMILRLGWSSSEGDLEIRMLDSNAIDGKHLFILPAVPSISE